MVDAKKTEGKNIAMPDAATDPTDNVAVELKLAREAKGLGLSDLHRLTGLSRTTLNQYESGARKPGTRELFKLCQVLEVSPNRILFGSEAPFEKTPRGAVTALAIMAKSDPVRAAGLSAVVIPLAASVLSKIGSEALFAIATLIDEILRERDPETYQALAAMIFELRSVPFEDFVNSPPEQREAFLNEIAKRIEEKATSQN